MAAPGGLAICSGHSSEQGLRPSMEDEIVIKERFSIPSRGTFSFFGVFDGHGGRSAAIFTRDHLFKHLQNALSSGAEPGAALTQAYLETDKAFISAVRGENKPPAPAPAPAPVAAPFSNAFVLPPSESIPNRRQQSANLAVRIPAASLPPVTQSVANSRAASEASHQLGAPALEKDTSGTTAVSALLHHESFTLWIANVGDSRAVLSTHSGAIVPLTNDHKADRADEVERIRRAGGFVVHKRVMGELAISRALGDADFKEVGFQFVLAHPELATQQLSQHDDFLLLACDGVFDVLSNEQACAFVKEQLAKGASLDDAAKAIVKHAIETLNTRDNVTVVLVKLPAQKELAAAGVARPDAPQLAAGSCSAAKLKDSHVATPLSSITASPSPAPTRSPFNNGAAGAVPATPAPSTPGFTVHTAPNDLRATAAAVASPSHATLAAHRSHQLPPTHSAAATHQQHHAAQPALSPTSPDGPDVNFHEESSNDMADGATHTRPQQLPASGDDLAKQFAATAPATF